MPALKIMLCDDQNSALDDYTTFIEQGAGKNCKIQRVGLDKLSDLLKALQEREAARLDGLVATDSKLLQSVDDCDILIFDHDLEKAGSQRPTAESFLGLVRAYTNCPFTIVLNKYPDVDFDLTLRIDYDTLADFAINAKCLKCPGLWSDSFSGKFRPWYWPNLSHATELRQRQIKDVIVNFETPIFRFFEFDKDDRTDTLSRTARAQLSHSGRYREITFAQYFHQMAKTLRPADRRKLFKRRKDNKDVIARIVAAEISAWLEREVLGPQDVLVDAPHLVSRRPALLRGDRRVRATWNATTELARPPTKLAERELSKFEFNPGHWLSRRGYWWPQLVKSRNVEIMHEKYFKSNEKEVRYVFCEDTSRFENVYDTREFVCDYHSIWDRRYIRHLSSYRYAPKVRMMS